MPKEKEEVLEEDSLKRQPSSVFDFYLLFLSIVIGYLVFSIFVYRLSLVPIISVILIIAVGNHFFKRKPKEKHNWVYHKVYVTRKHLGVEYLHLQSWKRDRQCSECDLCQTHDGHQYDQWYEPQEAVRDIIAGKIKDQEERERIYKGLPLKIYKEAE